MNCLLLSTPDINVSQLIDLSTDHFNLVVHGNLQDNALPKATGIDAAIHALHQRILTDHQRKWYQPLPDRMHEHHEADYRNGAREINKEHADQRLLLNDPLLCFFLPYWLQEAQASQLVFIYSHPSACASTLQQRWRFPLAFSLALWEHFVLSAARHLHQHKVALVSSQALSMDNKPYRSMLNEQLAPLQLTAPSDDDTPSTDKLEPELAVNQLEIYDALEKNDLSSLANREVAASSKDLLAYYGQLRAGYDQLQQENRQLLQSSHNQAADDKVSSPTVKLDDESDELYKVIVKVAGMQSIEFHAEPDSPILEMLQQHLLENDNDQLIYLNYGEAEQETIYFMSSSLQALEISPSTAE